MYRENYIRALLAIALSDMAGELSLIEWSEPDSLIDHFLLQAALLIEQQGLGQVLKQIQGNEPQLYEQVFNDTLTNNKEEAKC